ncbi:MAG: chromate efflux transporter [Geminicoccaceae bacterium]|nr:chromate efflux transporter [Geminicoccaceae bacterium]
MTVPDPPALPSLGEAVRTWARIALLSFGGPAGQIASMHRVLVEEKRWIGEGRFLHALHFCMLLPGPEAQQLTIYLGWLLNGLRGGLLAGILFVLPGYVALTGLSVLYLTLGRLPLVQAIFLGLRAAVLAIVLEAVIRIGRRSLRNRTMLGLAGLAFLALFALAVPFPLVVLGAALLGWLGGRFGLPPFLPGDGPSGHSARGEPGSALGETLPAHARTGPGWSTRVVAIGLPLWLAPTLLLVTLLGSDHVLTALARLASVLALVTFGGAYAVLTWLAQVAVETHGWLTPSEMLDGLALGETTPGPLIMVLLFVAFLAAFREPGGFDPLLAGLLGGTLVTWVTFVPCFVWILAGAPYVERLRADRTLAAALEVIGAAVTGVILHLATWFALHTLFLVVEPVRLGPLVVDLPVLASWNPAACLLTLGALLAVFRFRIGLAPLLLGGAAAGLGLHFLRFELLGFL